MKISDDDDDDFSIVFNALNCDKLFDFELFY